MRLLWCLRRGLPENCVPVWRAGNPNGTEAAGTESALEALFPWEAALRNVCHRGVPVPRYLTAVQAEGSVHITVC